VPLVEQDLLTLLEHMSSPPVFSGIMYEADLSVSVVQYHSELDRTSYDTKGNV
jgi:hypothetical protein